MYKEFVDLQYRYKTIRRIKKKYLTKKYLVIISEYKTGKLSVHRRTKRTKAERKRVVPPRLYGNISTAPLVAITAPENSVIRQSNDDASFKTSFSSRLERSGLIVSSTKSVEYRKRGPSDR